MIGKYAGFELDIDTRKNHPYGQNHQIILDENSSLYSLIGEK